MLASLQGMRMQLTFPDLAYFEGKLYGLPKIVVGRMKIANKYLKVKNNEEQKIPVVQIVNKMILMEK